MEQHMTPEEVAEKLSVSVATIYRHCKLGLGRKVGQQYRITAADIEAWFPKDTAHGIEREPVAKGA